MYRTCFLLAAAGCGATGPAAKPATAVAPPIHSPALKSADANQTVAPAPLPELIVPANATLDISASRWEYSRVYIESGGTLRVQPGSQQPLHLVVRGPMTIHGKLVARDASSFDRTVTVAVPNRPPLSLAYSARNRGGTGGNGGSAGGGSSGVGASGTADGGGGGGSGGGRYQQGVKPYVTIYKGRNAQGIEGAPWAGPNCGSPGGRGGERSPNGAGAVVYLEVYGPFDGSNGVIDVSGSVGPQGDAGRKGEATSPKGCQGGGGGGGGGGPGGQGGYVVGFVGGEILAYPQVNTSGGSGGDGGQPGGPSQFIGTRGTRGQSGDGGTAYWFTAAGEVTPPPDSRN